MDLDVVAGGAAGLEDSVDAILRDDPIGAYPHMRWSLDNTEGYPDSRPSTKPNA